MRTICVDLGVSFFKFAYFEESHLIESFRLTAPTSTPPVGGKHSFDLNLIYDLAKSGLDRLVKKYPDAEAILISTQMHGFALLNSSGRVISDYYTWMDTCSNAEHGDGSVIDHLKQSVSEKTVLATGMQLKLGMPSIGLHLLKKTNRELFTQGDVSFVCLGDYIAKSLAQTDINFASYSNAAGSGLFDLKRMDWSHELLYKIDLESLDLPDLISGIDNPVGSYKGINIYSSIGDQQGSLVGIWGADKPKNNSCVINIATGSQSSIRSTTLRLSNQYQTRPFVNGNFIFSVPFIPAGRALNSIVNFLHEAFLLIANVDLEKNLIWEKIQSINLDSNFSDLTFNTDIIKSFSNNGGSISRITEENLKLDNLLYSFFDDLTDRHIEACSIISGGSEIDEIMLAGGLPSKFSIVSKLIFEKTGLEPEKNKIMEDALRGLNLLAQNTVTSW